MVKKNNKGKPATQKYLDIKEIKDDCVILKSGTLRAVLLVSSINFALKSEEEQEAIIQAYVSFLNSFDFPLQIVIQSRRLNIEPYIMKLKEIEKEQTNELLRIQTIEYRQYVNELVELGEIMNKRFYVVVPLNPLEVKRRRFFTRLWESFQPVFSVKLSQERFHKRKRELSQRVEHVMSGLNSMGLQSVQLDTQGLIELFYNTYNPGMADKQKLTDLDKLRIE